jgi:hypothetical protein
MITVKTVKEEAARTDSVNFKRVEKYFIKGE